MNKYTVEIKRMITIEETATITVDVPIFLEKYSVKKGFIEEFARAQQDKITWKEEDRMTKIEVDASLMYHDGEKEPSNIFLDHDEE
jgi:hypothetical protein